MIFLILILGFVLRLIFLNQSLWLDEATTALVARNFGFGEIISKFSPADFHPPVYYLVIRAWSLVFGTSEIALRMPSVIFGTLTILVTYLIVKQLLGCELRVESSNTQHTTLNFSTFVKPVALLSALLSATSGLLIYYSQEARMYGLVTLLVSYLVYWFIKRKWFWFAVFLVLVGLTDYPALLILPVFWIFGRKEWRKLVICHLSFVICLFFWLPVLLKQLSAGSVVGGPWAAVLGQTNLKNIALIPVKFILGRISFENKTLYGVVVVIVAVLFGFLLFRSIRSIRKIRLIWLWFLIPLVLGALISFRIPTLSYFRYLFVLPAFYILIASGIATFRKPWFYLFAGCVLGVNLLAASAYCLVPKFHREDWRSLAQVMGNTEIVFPTDSQKEALIYYGKGKQIINAGQIQKQEKEIWLSRYVWEIFDPADTARQKVESLGFKKVGEYNFNGVEVWRYVR